MKDVIFKNLTEEQINAIKVLLGDACEIEEKVEEVEKKEEILFPSLGDKYFYLYSNGDIGDKRFTTDSYDDHERKLMGNIFKTQEEAEFEAERIRVIQEMKEFALVEDAWDYNVSHYYIYYNVSGDYIDEGSTYNYKQHDIYFESRVDINACINKVGKDRIIKYYFRIKGGNKE